VKKESEITLDLAHSALDIYQVDKRGLDWTDRLVLSTLIEQFQGGPAGLEAIAAATGEDAKTIEEVYEPYLLQIGYINRTARGRIATVAAYRHLGLTVPKRANNEQLTLFEPEV
jgi:Holliday junction DNA helicase RuvB